MNEVNNKTLQSQHGKHRQKRYEKKYNDFDGNGCADHERQCSMVTSNQPSWLRRCLWNKSRLRLLPFSILTTVSKERGGYSVEYPPRSFKSYFKKASINLKIIDPFSQFGFQVSRFVLMDHILFCQTIKHTGYFWQHSHGRLLIRSCT
jgi:hypothetical protein